MATLSPREHRQQRADQAAAASSRAAIESFFRETAKEVLIALARNPHLQERDLLRLLERGDLPREVVSELANHPEARHNYTVRFALVRHPKTPRLVSLPIIKFLYLFDLVRLTQTPAVPSDLKIIALARRAPGRLAASLLVSPDPELTRVALENPYLTEGHLLKVLAHENLL